MKYTTSLVVTLALALLITACATPVAGLSTPSAVPTTTQLSVTKLPVATATPIVVEAYPGVGTTPTATAAPTTSPPASGGTMVKARLSDRHGLILVNDDGFALYLYNKDTQHGETSACVDQDCTANWIPLTSEASPVAGAGAIQILLGTITREDGRMQVTYNGWPLYLFGEDNEAGSTNGQGMEREWFLVSPSGTVIPK